MQFPQFSLIFEEVHMEQSNHRFFYRIIQAISNFEFYGVVLKESFGTAMKYMVLLALLLGTIIGIKDYFAFNDIMSGVKTEVLEELPYFQIADGKFSYDGPRTNTIESGEGYITIIDLDEELGQESIKDYSAALYLTEDYAIYKKNSVEERKINFNEFAEMGDSGFSKDTIIKIVKVVDNMKFLGIFFLIIFRVIGKLIGTFVVSIIVLILDAIIKDSQLRFAQCYAVGIYAMTLPTLIQFIVKMTGASFTGWHLLYYVIVIVYAVLGLKKIAEIKQREIELPSEI